VISDDIEASNWNNVKTALLVVEHDNDIATIASGKCCDSPKVMGLRNSTELKRSSQANPPAGPSPADL
jgi:hypothetical protein